MKCPKCGYVNDFVQRCPFCRVDKEEAMNNKVPDASRKLRALCEGLEIQHLDTLLAAGQVGDYRRLGEKILAAAVGLVDLRRHADNCPRRKREV